MFQKQKIDLAVTTVEDTLTASGLAVLNIDTQALSLRGDLVLSDNNKNNDASGEYSNINDVTAMYEEILSLTAKNLGMENASQTSTYMANISTTNKLYNTNLYPACVKKVIFYDYVEGNIRRYTFTSLSSPKITHEIGSVSELKEVPIMDYSVTTDKPNEEIVKTPTNVEVATDTVSVYIEFQFPVKIMGIEQYVTKGIYVKLDLS